MSVLTPYLGGAIVGFFFAVLGALLFLPGQDGAMGQGSVWLTVNLGHSVWFFTIVLVFYIANLLKLREQLQMSNGRSEFIEIVQLDQVSDVWIHLFVGIGVVWTAIGMRSALASTLGAPASLNEDAGQVLGRLVDGGILLALTTTIVGAVGGYMMRLGKTCWLGAELAAYYHCHERQEITAILDHLSRIEAHLAAQGAEHASVKHG
jgi:hypothetical protein